MSKCIELPLTEPIYSTYNFQLPTSAILYDNPSIRNWYLNEVIMLLCTRKFLDGFTTPEIKIEGSSWKDNPYIDKYSYDMQFLNGSVNNVIRNLIDSGYYVCYSGVDDYYIQGKTWYHERHFKHDGMICGYNQDTHTYCIHAHDSKWLCNKFWTPQSGFNKGRTAMAKQGIYGTICGIKAKTDIVEFSPSTAISNIEKYLDSNMKKYPVNGPGRIRGIAVHNYIAKYIGKLYDGSIPYERMDWRVLRLIWEHKKAMLERIKCIEEVMNLKSDISQKYEAAVVNEANTIRMLYASHSMRRRDSVLPVIQKKLLSIKTAEQRLLNKLLHIARCETT